MRFEIKRIVVSAAGVKLRPARGTGIPAAHILTNREFSRAGTAKDGALVPLAFRPDRRGMPCERRVAILAGIVNSAALHFDGNDVSRAAVVLATRLGIELNPADFWMPCRHWVGRVKHLSTDFAIPFLPENFCPLEQESSRPSRAWTGHPQDFESR